MSKAPSQPPYPHLLSPIRLGRHELKNRIAFIATVTNFGVANRITPPMVDYYGARAEGGAGLIVTEGLIVHETAIPAPPIVYLGDPANADGLKRIAAAVEPKGCRLLGQLWHVGRQQLWSPVSSPWGVSAQPDALSWSVPRVMSAAEIGELVAAFVAGARKLREAGFSGAELHGAHGYLITQFLSPWSNTREDGYGGDLEGRTRFVREIVAGIRQECGADFLLGLKLPGSENVAGGIDLAEAQRITRRLAALGQLDYFAYGQGNFSASLEDHCPDMHYAPGPFLELHAAIKADLREDFPDANVMALGRVTSAEHGERVLASGGADLIGFARVLVAEPALAAKAAAGEQAPGERIRPCIFCNLCWGEIHAGKPVACILNPELGRPDEAHPAIAPAAIRRKVVVVGAGPAGLEAAWTAAARGHEVLLLGASPEPGGKARWESRLPGRGEVALALDYQAEQARSRGVRFQLGQPADAAAIRALEPGVVVLATGSGLRPPALEPGSEPFRDLREATAALLDGRLQPPAGSTAVLFDQDHGAATYAAAELLAARFARVVLLTPRTQIGRAVNYVSLLGVYRRLYRAGVRIELAALPQSLRAGRVTWRHAFTGETASVDDVALACFATPRLAADGLAAPLRAAGLEVKLAGDCYSPRGLMAAIHEGHRIGASL